MHIMETVTDISLEGFKVVSSDYFYAPTRMQVPTLTVWDGSIGFSRQDLAMLNNCENVMIQVNTESRKIIVIPSTSKDKDAVRWIKRTNPLEARKLTCKRLTDSLYSAWEWDINYIYRTTGKLVTANNKVMLLFDFSEPESWKRPEAKNVE